MGWYDIVLLVVMWICLVGFGGFVCGIAWVLFFGCWVPGFGLGFDVLDEGLWVYVCGVWWLG